MFENKRLDTWPNAYWNQIQRNIGIITIKEQELLRESEVVIFGVGGLGGSIAEQLTRCGFERIIICDNDKFEESNLNRQLCTIKDLGKFKVDVLEDFLKTINPNIKLQKFYNIDKSNISKIVENTVVAVLIIDDSITSILIARECLKKQIPLLESWGIPYLWAWWFTPQSIDYEACYGYPTKNLTIDQIRDSDNIESIFRNQLFDKITKFPNISQIYDREKGALKGMASGSLPFVSLAPVVRLTASYLAFEVSFSGILKIKKKILAPHVIGYDYYHMNPLDFHF